MYRVRVYHGDALGVYKDKQIQYWEEVKTVFETYDKALLYCYKQSLKEVTELMRNAEPARIYVCDDVAWFETYNLGYEILEDNENKFLEDVDWFDIATLFYSMPPWARENNCDIEIETGYLIVEVEGE